MIGDKTPPMPIPGLLRQGLEVRQGHANRVIIRDINTGQKVVLSESDFFIINHLSCHDTLDELEEQYLARFSHTLPVEALNRAIDAISTVKFWGPKALHHSVIGPRLPEQVTFESRRSKMQNHPKLQRRAGTRTRQRTNSGINVIKDLDGREKTSRRPSEYKKSSSPSIDSETGARVAESSETPASGQELLPVHESTIEERKDTNNPTTTPALETKSVSEPADPGKTAKGKIQRQEKSRSRSRKQEHKRQSRRIKKSIFPQIKLFDPRPMMDLALPFLAPIGKPLAWSVPVLLIMAAFILFRHFEVYLQEHDRIYGYLSFLARVALGLITINLFSTTARGLVARHFGMKIYGFGVRMILWMLPRLIVATAPEPSDPKSQRAWVAGAPLLVKLFFAGGGIVFWYLSRANDSGLSFFWFWMAGMGFVTFLLTSIPFFPSAGYQLLCIYLDEPNLRQKSFASLKASLTGKRLPAGGSFKLAAFGALSLIFVILILAVILYFIGTYSKLYFSTTGITLATVFTCYLLYQLYKRMAENRKDREEKKEKRAQLGRNASGRRSLRVQNKPAPGPGKLKLNPDPAPNRFRWLKYVLLVVLIAIMFVPYSYETGGRLVLKPLDYQEVTTDIGGIIDEVYFSGGENIAAGTLIARLDSATAERQMKIAEARVSEQKAELERLRAMPTAEELELAEKALATEQLKAEYSARNLERKEAVFKKNVISEEEIQKARREYEVDKGRAIEAEARVALVKAGATQEQLLAAKAELLRWTEERNLWLDKYEKSFLYMPIDGKLTTMYLKQRTGEYLNTGESFAVVEDTSSVLAEIEVPEFDSGVIKLDSKVRVRVWAYSDEIFVGHVQSIQSNIEERSFGNVVKVVTILDNSDQRLKTGMTGYAKISAGTRPVWQVLFLTILRFVQVEMWSWLP
jgi:putative peptide zinc metalloprotease protein